MKKRQPFWILLGLAQFLIAGQPADNTVVDFRASGIVVAIQGFFDVARDQTNDYQTLGTGKGEYALVTSSGVYAFLETPSNDRHLRGLSAGDAIDLTGRLLERGGPCCISRK